MIARNQRAFFGIALLGVLFGSVSAAHAAAVPVATYNFNNTLNANELGAPSLVSVDPLGLNGFESAVVKGVTQNVFRWNGTGSPASLQAGLVLDATGLVQYNNYSVQLVFEFLELSQFGGGWRRIVDTQNRQSDNGFYVDPGNFLQVYPVVTGSTLFITPGFHDVLLTNLVVDGLREVKAYLDGVLELTSDTDQLNLDNTNNPGHLLNFFLDNLAGPAQNEFADGRIAFLQLSDGILVPTPPSPSPVPGAPTLALVLIGLGLVGTLRATRARNSRAAQ